MTSFSVSTWRVAMPAGSSRFEAIAGKEPPFEECDLDGGGPAEGSLCGVEAAGERLLTFYEFPQPLWRVLHTMNSLENLNREFRRRTKTQGSFSSEEAGLTFGAQPRSTCNRASL